ncbi:MAG: exodeoxyribonuclease V subunit beta, partial [Gammaproteobacteria bacterium]
DDAFLIALRAAYPEAERPGCARRLELAANWMDEAAIYTIHAWCNRMLQQHAFDSGSLFKQEVDNDDAELLNEVVRDYWRSCYYGLSRDEPSFEALYAQFKQPSDLFGEIRTLLTDSADIGTSLAPGGDVKTLIDAVASHRRETLGALKLPWRAWAGEIRSLLQQAVKDKVLPARNYKANSIEQWTDRLAAWSEDPESEMPDIGKGIENLTPAGMIALANAGRTPPSHPGFDAIAALPERIAALPNLKVELIKHAVHWIRRRYDSEKQRLARLTFDDMLTRLDRALMGDNGERLAALIRQQYPIVLIDEFQDTDPIQYRIFETLYKTQADPATGCFMIGDPKQSIYSFRGADIYTYLRAHKNTAGRHYTLDTNYRSTHELVAAVNRIFEHGDRQEKGAFLFKHGGDDPLPFVAVGARGRDRCWSVDDRPAAAMTLWQWHADEPVALSEYRETLAQVAADTIVDLLQKADRGAAGFRKDDGLERLKPSDIAVLVRSGREARTIRNALAQRSVRSVYLSERDSIFATQEARDVLLWLSAFAEPRNERKVRGALGTATLGWPYRKLQELAANEPAWERQLERFLDYQRRWQQDGVLPALRQMLHDYALHVRLGATGEGERCLTNLLHLAELLQQAGSKLEGEQALIRYLAEAIASESAPAGNEGIVRLESDADLIKIVTLHKSKGLEYPLVFLPFVCGFREVGGPMDKYYRYHDEQQRLTVDLTKSQALKMLSDEERLQEDLRLLYVGATRARYACWLGIAPVKSGNTQSCLLHKSAMGHLLGWQADMPADALSDRLAELKGGCASIAVADLPAIENKPYRSPLDTVSCDGARIAAKTATDDWWVASYSALPFEETHAPVNQDAVLSDEPETARDDKHSDEARNEASTLPKPLAGVHGLPRGAGPGVLIHDLLEQCAHLGFAAVRTLPALAEEVIRERFGGGEWADQHALIASLLGQWLGLPLLPESKLCLADLAKDAYQAELEFLIGADTVDTRQLDRLVRQYTFSGRPRPALLPGQINGMLKGFIDLAFVHEQRYYVLDYKFNGLGDDDAAYSLEVLEQTMLAKRYDLQFTLYLLALHRLLKARL